MSLFGGILKLLITLLLLLFVFINRC